VPLKLNTGSKSAVKLVVLKGDHNTYLFTGPYKYSRRKVVERGDSKSFGKM